MADLNVEVVAVEQQVWSGTASIVSAQTTEGEIGIMAGHQPMFGQLIESGVVSATTPDGERNVWAVHGGFLAVTSTHVTVLAEWAEPVAEIDVDAARAVLANSEASEEDVVIARSRVRAVERA
ncbi:F0F1 ATP synthase subunit epsilon [Millisia brevis]|uniref:F0F1 ATP synthase subunit epsilon n=1 Tax=Millisia brevis TaxID=264148 RepID=UPI00082DA7BE|nr:F0F1 ATP synthase subunit epsilon [Millisia brevis]